MMTTDILTVPFHAVHRYPDPNYIANVNEELDNLGVPPATYGSHYVLRNSL